MEKQHDLITNSSEIEALKAQINDQELPSILCTNIKASNPNFLGIIHANGSFCDNFKIDHLEVLGKSYDFLFDNQDTDYSSDNQIELVKLINAAKNQAPCSINQSILNNRNSIESTNYRINFEPITSHSNSKYYALITFDKTFEDDDDNRVIKARHKDIGSKNQELVKNLERALNNEKILREISYQIISDKSVKDIAKNICESICKILKVDRCLIHNVNENNNINFIVEYNNLNNEELNIDYLEALEYINDHNSFYNKIRQNLTKTSIFVVNDVKKDPNSAKHSKFHEKYNITSQICAISLFNNKSNGGIYVFSSSMRNPTIDEIEMIEIIADQLSIAIERSSSIEKIILTNHELLQKTQQLKKSIQKEKEMREMQSKFITLVSHEFKTPLQIIDSTRELISRKIKSLNLEDDSFDKYSQRVKNAIKRMTNLINSTLSLAKIEENEEESQVTTFKQDFHLHNLLDDVISKISDLSIKRNVSIEKLLNSQNDLIHADSSLLEHCFSNIISNSIKYSKKDTTVKIETICDEDNIKIIVSDQGIGIPADDLKQIGQKFFRSSNTLSESGSGIGLYLTKYFIELHNGSVTIESIEDEGTQVIITLPKK